MKIVNSTGCPMQVAGNFLRPGATSISADCGNIYISNVLVMKWMGNRFHVQPAGKVFKYYHENDVVTMTSKTVEPAQNVASSGGQPAGKVTANNFTDSYLVFRGAQKIIPPQSRCMVIWGVYMVLPDITTTVQFSTSGKACKIEPFFAQIV